MPPTPHEGEGRNWRAGTRDASSLQTRIETWLLEHPGLHRPVDIAEALGEPTAPVARACVQLHIARRAVRAEILQQFRDQYEFRNGSRWTGYRLPDDTESVAAR